MDWRRLCCRGPADEASGRGSPCMGWTCLTHVGPCPHQVQHSSAMRCCHSHCQPRHNPSSGPGAPCHPRTGPAAAGGAEGLAPALELPAPVQVAGRHVDTVHFLLTAVGRARAPRPQRLQVRPHAGAVAEDSFPQRLTVCCGASQGVHRSGGDDTLEHRGAADGSAAPAARPQPTSSHTWTDVLIMSRRAAMSERSGASGAAGRQDPETRQNPARAAAAPPAAGAPPRGLHALPELGAFDGAGARAEGRAPGDRGRGRGRAKRNSGAGP